MICFSKTTVLVLPILLMIPLLINVVIHLTKSLIILKQPQKKFLNDSVLTTKSKCHLLASPYEPVSLNARGSTIESSSCKKLLGIFIDSNFTFKYHICRKTSQKLHAFSKISKYISGDKKRSLFKLFIISQFSYCPIFWMCHGRGLNNKINNLNERALRTIYQDKKSSF